MAPILILFSALRSSRGAGSETQKYETLFKKGSFEIRHYPPAVMASVEMKGTYDRMKTPGFKMLAGYIFGGNNQNKRISMTTPVRVSEEGGTGKMSFVMPSEFKRENLPKTENKKIMLHETEPGHVAALHFGGFSNDKKIEIKKEELKHQLAKLGIKHSSRFEYLGYSAPSKLVNRRNEVIVFLDNFNPDSLKTIDQRIDEA